MNKEKAIEFVMDKLELSGRNGARFDDLSVSYDQIKLNDIVILNRKFSDESMYVKIKALIENIWEIETCEKEIDKLMK